MDITDWFLRFATEASEVKRTEIAFECPALLAQSRWSTLEQNAAGLGISHHAAERAIQDLKSLQQHLYHDLSAYPFGKGPIEGLCQRFGEREPHEHGACAHRLPGGRIGHSTMDV